MRVVFLIVLLTGAIFYSYIAFENLNFMTRTGRLGPGFFPRLIGLAAIVFTFWVLVSELRRRTEDDYEGDWRDVAVLMVLALVYGILLRVFGGFVSTVIFLAAALTFLDRGRTVRNAVIAVAVPVAVYLLFDKVLNASMPPALIDIVPI